jgi:uncharacterized membrane protein
MISRHFWRLRAFLRRIWVRVTLFAVLAVASVALARVLSPLLPDWVADQVGTRAVDGILQLLATSMLAVTTFSLSIAVSAFATPHNSPRRARQRCCSRIPPPRMCWPRFWARFCSACWA